ncbi:hypothetical protein [Ekhidna sp.]|uniref:hypothetical protein n=1 Tax=Ekhidna sp. TaxID=2608089 RepID=UPI0032978965
MAKSDKLFSRRFILWSTGILILLLGLGSAIFFFGKNTAGLILNEVIKRETNGFYQLDFESLELDLLESRIKVSMLSLSADSSADFAGIGLKNVYEIQLDELIIDLESIYALYFEKELIIKSVRVVDPNIDMVSLESAKKTKFSLEAGNMYQAISDYLRVLKIDYFRIQDGELQYDGNEFTLGSIDFLVKNLVMDSISRENQVFYSEEISLEIRNQLFHLPDSIHEITFDKFVLSTSDSILSFENLRIKPTATSGITFKGQNDINVYDIHVPKLSLKGIDYVAAYQDNHLIIEELILEEPTVFVDDESHTASTKKDIDNSLLTLIFKVFGSLDVRKLNIQNAHVDLKIDGDEKYQRFKVEKSNIVFHNIHLDTSNYRFDHRFKYFEDIELDIHNYTYLLPDSVHTAYFELLKVNSFDSEVLFENMVISHERAGNESKVLIDMDVPVFRLKNVDFQRAIADKVLNVGTFEIPSGFLEVKNSGSKMEKKKASVSALYKSLSPIFREISVDQLQLSDMELILPNGIGLEEINLSMRGVHLNAASKSFQKLFDDSKLEVSGLSFDQDSILIAGNKLLVDDQMTTLQLLKWQIEIDQNDLQVKGQFDTLQLTGVVLDSLIEGNYTQLTRAILINPDIEFNIKSKGSGGELNVGIEKELIISNGKLRGTIDSLEVSMNGLDADVFAGDSTAFRRVAIEQINIRSKELNHKVEIARWEYDTLGNEMAFDSVHITPIDRLDTGILQLEGFIPFLRLTAFEQAKFFDEKHLFASLVHIANPQLKLKIPKIRRDSSTKKNRAFTMAIQELRLDTGRIIVHLLGNTNLDSLSIAGINTSIFDIDFPSDNVFENGTFYSSSLNFFAEELTPYMSSGDTLNFRNIDYSSTEEDLLIDSIHFVTIDNSLKVDIPSLNVRNLDVQSFYEKGAFKVDSLIISNPSGTNRLVESDTGKKPFTTPLSIDYLSLDNISWVYKDSTNEDLHLNNGNLLVENFHSTDTLTAKNILNRMSNLSFDAGPFKVPLPDSYTLSVEKYRFDFPANDLNLKNVRLISDFSAEEYSERLEEQNDWFDVKVKDISFEQIDMGALLSTSEYAIENVVLQGVDALIYRDKGVTFPEDQVRHLPQRTIRNISTKFQIDTLSLNGSVRYREKPENYSTYGEISFDDMQAQLVNVGNRSIVKSELMLLEARGKLMGAGGFEVKGAFNMKAKDEPFSLNGRVKEFPLDSMNRMLGPVANVNIKSGYAKDLYFNFSANDTLSRGDMRFRYNDLKIQILNVKTHDTQGFGQGIKTFFANTFVVKNKNPSYLLFLRKGTIFEKRDTSRAIFNYWGKSLLSGAVSSIGVHKSDKAEKKFERKID